MRTMLAKFAVFFLVFSTARYASAQLAPAPENEADLVRLALMELGCAAPTPEQEVIDDMLQLCSMTPIPAPTPELQQPPENFKRVPIDNAEIAYLRFGNTTSGRPPLIVIPGLDDTIGTLPRSVILDFSKNQEVILMDNRGQGLSTDLNPPGTPLSIEVMANDTAAFVSALNLTDPNVLGISMGGMVASALATDHGDQFGVFVVAHGSAGGLGTSTPTESQAADILINQRWNLTAFFDVIYNLTSPRGVDLACTAYYAAIANPVASPENSTTTQRQVEAIREWFLGTGVYSSLPSVTNPMLLVGGLNDTVVPVQNVRVMAEALPDAWLAIFPGKHAAYYENEDSFMELYETFYDVYGAKQ